MTEKTGGVLKISMEDRSPKLSTMFDTYHEIQRAREKFPDAKFLLAALMEEVGELSKALLEESDQCVYAEAMQVATVAMRIMEEGDPSIRPHYRPPEADNRRFGDDNAESSND